MLFLENLLSGTLPFSFLTLCGIYISFKTNFCQITRFGESLKLTFKAFLKTEKTKDITSVKSACTALSATVGTGNIAGVAGAIAIGGAGAIFWMWISAILGMCIKSAEITLAINYREKTKDGLTGGPIYYIKNGLGRKFKPLIFLFCVSSTCRRTTPIRAQSFISNSTSKLYNFQHNIGLNWQRFYDIFVYYS